jgi:hypothetical protein
MPTIKYPEEVSYFTEITPVLNGTADADNYIGAVGRTAKQAEDNARAKFLRLRPHQANCPLQVTTCLESDKS